MALTVTPNNDGNTLLNSLLGNTSGLSNFSITTTGLPAAFGLFSNDTVFGLGSGVVLSTGNVVDVVGPNNSSSTSGPGSLAQIDINFDTDSTVDKLFFEYVFGSEEFLEYAGKSFGSYLSLSKNLFTLSCETFSKISANLQHPPCFGSDSKNRV